MLGSRLVAGATLLLVALGAHAQYPDRTVRIVVPFAAGGGTDVQARVAAARLAARFKQPFIVENRGGAGGNIGTAAVTQSPADGYTLLFVTPATVINQSLYAKPGYNVQRDFAAVASWATSPLLIIAATSVPAHDLKALVAYAKANPGKLSFASAGPWPVYGTWRRAMPASSLKNSMTRCVISPTPPLAKLSLPGFAFA